MYRLENIEDLKVGMYFTFVGHHDSINLDKIIRIDTESKDFDDCIKYETINRIHLSGSGIVTYKSTRFVYLNRDLTREPKEIIVLDDDDAKFFVDMFAKIDAVNAIRNNTIRTINQSLKEKFDNVKKS